MEKEPQDIIQAIQSGQFTGDLLSQIMQAVGIIPEDEAWADQLPPMEAINAAIAEAEAEAMWDPLPMEAIDAAMEQATRCA